MGFLKKLDDGAIEASEKNCREIHIEKCIAPIYGCMMAVIIAICIFMSKINFGRNGFCKNYLPGLVLLMLGGIFICGVVSVCMKFSVRKIQTKYIFPCIVLLIFIGQVYGVWNYYFYTDWDVQTIINLSDVVAHDEPIAEWLENYFSTYPNNLLLVFLFSKIIQLVHCLGFHEHEYFSLLFVQCLLNTGTGLLLYKVLDQLFQKKYLPMVGYVIYFFLIGLSPWVSIPYSDSVCLIFPVLMIYIYMNRKKGKGLFSSWLIIAIISVIGYKIKPQVLIVFIAMIMINAIEALKLKNKREILKGVLAILIGIICAGFISQMACSSMNIDIDENKTFNMQHFFMMGMNTEKMGVYAQEDVAFSASFDTVEERNAADMDLAIERIQDMGMIGVSKQLIRKTLTNYYNGTFCWGGEGNFFVTVFEDRSSAFSEFVRGLYYSRDYADVGKYYTVWSNFEQMMWLTTLAIGIFSAFAAKNSNKDVIMLSIIGLTVFELLFEARARYLYTFVPLYIVLGVYGIEYAANKIEKRRD
jgi:hypothetical protein